jgi:hypothetical protein
MPSNARKAFARNSKDVKALLEWAEVNEAEDREEVDNAPETAALLKSCFVLITAIWEAYCEDIAAEGLAHLVKHAESSTALPKKLKQQVATELNLNSEVER